MSARDPSSRTRITAPCLRPIEVVPAMHGLVRTLLVGLGSLCGSLAAAQTADRDVGAAALGARCASAAPPPAFTVHNSGSNKSVFVPFGDYITQTGVGGGGANV